MLLPSTIACDAASQRLQSALASPPMSPLSSTSPASTVSDIIATSRSLHAILASTPTLEHKSSLASTQVHTAVLAPSPMLSPAVSPTFAHAPAPLKLHLHNSSHQSQRYAVRNPTPPPTASASTFSTSIITPKRKRTATLDLSESPMPPMASHSSVKRRRIDSGLDASSLSPAFSLPTLKPCTPKRARTCPEVMPLGLSRSDFDDVWGLEHEQKQEPCSPAVSLMSVASSSASSVFDSISTASTYDASNSDTEDWTDEDDDALIDIVLKKLRLSRQEWHECARTLGRNRSTISQRWKSLLMGGEIGLKRAHPASCR